MVIGFSILRSQAVTRRSTAVALFRHPRQLCAACPQTRKRRQAVGGPRGGQLHIGTVKHKLGSIKQLTRKGITTQQHEPLRKNKSMSELGDGSSRKAFQRTS